MLIAIEGIDGAGKCTQSELLKVKAQKLGLSAEVLSFPRYGKTLFAKSIADYLNGEFGDLSSVPSQFAALLYAGDRFESLTLVKQLARANDLLIFDRYVASNLAYQAAKLSRDKRQDFISWLAQIEYEIFGLPKTDLTIYLDITPSLALELVYKKDPRSYTTKVADIHERSTIYLAKCREVYQTLADMNFGGRWFPIQSVGSDGSIRPISEIHDDIWHVICQEADLSNYFFSVIDGCDGRKK
jgi:dTMP kinase